MPIQSLVPAPTAREAHPPWQPRLPDVTPEYGMHLTENRLPALTFMVDAQLMENSDFGALGKLIGEKIEASKAIPYILGVRSATARKPEILLRQPGYLWWGCTLPHAWHHPGSCRRLLPLMSKSPSPRLIWMLPFIRSMMPMRAEVDFVSLGCPHLTIQEIARIAHLLEGRQVNKEFWITTARPIKQIADRLGYTRIIEACRSQVCCRYLLCRRSHPGALHGHGNRQCQSVLLCLCQEQIQDGIPAV